jgi:hypothetical protein
VTLSEFSRHRSTLACSMSGEPSNFNARTMARRLASRGRPHAKRQSPGPRPTLAELQRSHCWTWVYCEKCLHHAPMALVPLIIRWGAEASSDQLRQCARRNAGVGMGKGVSSLGLEA